MILATRVGSFSPILRERIFASSTLMGLHRRMPRIWGSVPALPGWIAFSWAISATTIEIEKRSKSQIEEHEKFPEHVDARRVRLRYPDKAHDAESLAVHPDGTVFILTKGDIPQLFRLRKDQWMNSNGKLQTLELVTPIDFEKLGGAAAAMDGRLPTAMDISPDGKRILVLTYRNVFELLLDLSQPLPPVATWKAGINYRRFDVEVLNQQEGIAFTPDGRSFLYDSEKPLTGPGRIMRSDCK